MVQSLVCCAVHEVLLWSPLPLSTTQSSEFRQLVYQQAVFAEALYYLVEHLALHAHTIGFPELAFPSVRELRHMAKTLGRPEWSTQVWGARGGMGQFSFSFFFSVSEGVCLGLAERENVF